MKHLVVYDIPNDRIRGKIADVCLDYGLDRIQWSAFLGDLTRTHQEELWQKLSHVLGKQPGNIQLFPICESDWKGRQVLVREGKDK
ncbi:MAG: CRISPR-associated endonuclease Cas2 [Anaerolineae bacterium]